jgi:hypothetical protein
MGNEPRRDRRDRRHAECSQNVYDPILHPELAKLRAVLSGTGDPISCDFVPMIWDILPLLTRPCVRLGKAMRSFSVLLAVMLTFWTVRPDALADDAVARRLVEQAKQSQLRKGMTYDEVVKVVRRHGF